MSYKGKSILIIGAGIFQTFAIKIAKDLGLNVCVIDYDEQAPGIRYASDFKKASTKNIIQAIKAAKYFHNKYKLDGVFTCGTDVSYTVAKIAQELRLPGVSEKTALKATNKGEMRKALKKAGIYVPEFGIVSTLENAIKITHKLGFPLVIKPVDNMGARGVRKISSLKELRLSWDEAYKNSYTKNIILEKYIPGKEVSIDTIVYKGKVHLITIADRIISSSPYFIEKGHTIPSNLTKTEIKKAFEMASRGIKALGIKNGASKFDMKISKNGPVIGEMTARLSGGFHSAMTEPLATGMNSIKAAIDISLGLPLDLKDITPRFNHAAVERSIYPPPGKIIEVKGIDKAKKLTGIADVVINIKKGGILKPLNSNIGKAGHIIGYGKTRKNAIKNVLYAVKEIQIKTIPI